jgi:hypothetical protein
MHAGRVGPVGLYRRLLSGALAVAVLWGCSPSPTVPPPTPPPVATSAPSPSIGEEAAIRLRPAPANLGCDAILPPYRSVTFRIDPGAEEQVWATTDLGGRLSTFWSAGFQGGSVLDPVVRDETGAMVARDGEVLAIPEGAWPRLHGHFVCPGVTAIYVFNADPQ